MDVTIKKCDSRTLPDLLRLIDNEFIYSKGRSASLTVRYPKLFSADNLENVYVACSGGTVYATTTVRKFDLLSDGQVWKGAMIGLVCTASEARGRGFGTLVMDAIVREYKNSDTDFLVLWTGINSFYGRMGWVTEDEGAFSKVDIGKITYNNNLVIPDCYENADFNFIELIREKFLPLRVKRVIEDYKVIPPNVDVVEYYIFEEKGVEGYAIVGRKERTGYIYEIVGSHNAFSVLIQSIVQNVDNLFTNDRPDSASGLWLTENKCVEWHSQNQTMWYKLSAKFTNISCKKIYVPYFDRI